MTGWLVLLLWFVLIVLAALDRARSIRSRREAQRRARRLDEGGGS